jgi:hypothetical protein
MNSVSMMLHCTPCLRSSFATCPGGGGDLDLYPCFDGCGGLDLRPCCTTNLSEHDDMTTTNLQEEESGQDHCPAHIEEDLTIRKEMRAATMPPITVLYKNSWLAAARRGSTRCLPVSCTARPRIITPRLRVYTASTTMIDAAMKRM